MRELTVTSTSFRKEVERSRATVVLRGRPVTNKETLQEAMSAALHTTVDGAGLSAHSGVSSVHKWVVNGTAILSGSSYVHCAQLRISTLHTAARAARGGQRSSSACDACGRYESLAHILQSCPRTHGLRVQRHDILVQKLSVMAKRRGWTVIVEPHIRTSQGLRKPDLVLFRQAECHVIDASVVADCGNLSDAYDAKVRYYDCPDIRRWCEGQFPEQETPNITFGALILNWRGAMCPRSYSLLRQVGLSNNELAIYSISVLESGYRVYRSFKSSTGAGPLVD